MLIETDSGADNPWGKSLPKAGSLWHTLGKNAGEINPAMLLGIQQIFGWFWGYPSIYD
jgi:hypothetical protein